MIHMVQMPLRTKLVLTTTNRQHNNDHVEGDNNREPEQIDAQEAIHKLIEHTHPPHYRPSF